MNVEYRIKLIFNGQSGVMIPVADADTGLSVIRGLKAAEAAGDITNLSYTLEVNEDSTGWYEWLGMTFQNASVTLDQKDAAMSTYKLTPVKLPDELLNQVMDWYQKKSNGEEPGPEDMDDDDSDDWLNLYGKLP